MQKVGRKEKGTHNIHCKCLIISVGDTGFEPVTPCLSSTKIGVS